MDLLEKAKPLFVSEEAKKLFVSFASQWESYQAEMQRALTLAGTKKVAERDEDLTRLLVDVRTKGNAIDDLLGELSLLKEARAKKASEETTSIYESSRALMIGIIAGGLLIGVALGFFISRSVTTPLRAAVDVANRLAAGDLSMTVSATSRDETGQLLQAMQSMVEKLKVVIVGQQRVVEAANHGNFEARIEEAGLSGFQKEMAQGLNALVTVTGTGLEDVVRVLGSVSAGDLSKNIDKPYEGLFGRTKEYVNTTVERLQQVIDGQKRVVDAANHGDFSERIELKGLAGFQLEMGLGLNALATTTGASIEDVVRVMAAMSEGNP